MDKFIRLSEKDKRVYFEVAAADLNVMPQLIEKDFWVCWTLKEVFSLPKSGEHLTFKGGTSLSKCYGVIKRFSEDVDLSISRQFLAVHEPIEPDNQQSGKENKRRLARLKQLCQEKIANTIMPELKNRINTVLSKVGLWSIELDPDDPDRQTVLFAYPSVIKDKISSYIRQVVKIEFGARSDNWPVERKLVNPYVSRASSRIIIKGTPVRVLAVERTFWEKATILHMIHHYPHDKDLPLRMARHYYDLFAMTNSPIYKKSLEKISLLKNVSEHKALFFKAKWAHYEEAKPETLRLLPREDQISRLKADYQQMREMFFEDPPAFEEILERLKMVEEEINQIKK